MQRFQNIFKNRSALFWIIVIQIFVLGIVTLSIDFKPASIASWFQTFGQSVYAIPATFGIYVLSAFVNVPQLMLHTGVVLTFGPVIGSLVAWIATLISASFNFWLGQRMGADRISKISSGNMTKVLRLIRKHGFLASMGVRIVPTGPFILVNMVAGVTHMKFSHFFVGTAIGIIPKIAIVVFLSEGVKATVTGKGPIYVAIVVAIALIWMGIIYATGSRLKRKMANDNEDVQISRGKTEKNTSK